jgi:hypothetical protein
MTSSDCSEIQVAANSDVINSGVQGIAVVGRECEGRDVLAGGGVQGCCYLAVYGSWCCVIGTICTIWATASDSEWLGATIFAKICIVQGLHVKKGPQGAQK